MTSHKIDDVTQQHVRAYPAARIGRAYRYQRAHRRNYSNAFWYFWFGDIIKHHTFEFTSLKVENGVVEVADDEDDIAIDSKGTAVLRFVPATVTGLL